MNQEGPQVSTRIVTADQVTTEMEEYAQQHFHCSSEEVFRRLEAGELPRTSVAALHLTSLRNFRDA